MNVFYPLLPTKENIWKTRTDFRLLSKAVEIEWSQNNAIANVKVVDEYVFWTKEPMYYSLYFGEKRWKRARKLYEQWYYTED